jgi:hypothetical protein
MIRTQWPVPPAARAAGVSDRLSHVVDRIAGGDRSAFRCLYAFLAMRVWRDAVRVLSDPADARAVTRSTFVEVWHMAGRQVDNPTTDTRGWVSAISAIRIDERLHTREAPYQFLGAHDRHIHCELAGLLGAGPATVRIGPANFVRVDDLSLDLVR